MTKNRNEIEWIKLVKKTCKKYNIPEIYQEKMIGLKINKKKEFNINTRGYKFTLKHFPSIIRKYKEAG